ncbi:uncharacterized protein CELE_F36D3.14 [Caenorhabditis elegans]|uniref:Secreted protein n=1 Tax=Caenorhabditis elegans TaxID=6239 RepID=Q564U2_CAEEL|nr:Secreted protein [Caenorhabditis elegans]CAI79226.1 Secreted protein [Caenorhabditis elegans]|eukprot:NP_001023884.1 Uncharacterized protein CELE_F36D3.14 [Caenorhabditis elegans]
MNYIIFLLVLIGWAPNFGLSQAQENGPPIDILKLTDKSSNIAAIVGVPRIIDLAVGFPSVLFGEISGFPVIGAIPGQLPIPKLPSV